MVEPLDKRFALKFGPLDFLALNSLFPLAALTPPGVNNDRSLSLASIRHVVTGRGLNTDQEMRRDRHSSHIYNQPKQMAIL